MIIALFALSVSQAEPAAFVQPSGAELAKGKAKKGEKLWSDPSLSKDGTQSCSSCHTPLNGGPYAMMNGSFAQPYPHPVQLAKDRAGHEAPISAAEMVNFCLLVPMKSDALPWDSKTLANLAAYVESLQGGFTPPKVPTAD